MNMLLRGVPPGYAARIKRIASSKNLSVNQIAVRYVMRGVDQDDSREDVNVRHAKAMREIEKMRKQMYKEHGMSDDAVQMIREMRDSRYGK